MSAKVLWQSKLIGKFRGWEGDTVFSFANGQQWRQCGDDDQEANLHRPEAQLIAADGRIYLRVLGFDQVVEVKPFFRNLPMIALPAKSRRRTNGPREAAKRRLPYDGKTLKAATIELMAECRAMP